MIDAKRGFWVLLTVGFFLACGMLLYFLIQKTLGLPFREANDMLHETNAPVTLDFLIPAGFHIDQTTSIGEVVRHRFQKPKGKITLLLTKISESVPARYRYVGTAILYFFWTFLFLVFFRIFTWMGYALALRISFLCGAIVYLFVPDLVVGWIDDAVCFAWSIVLFATARHFRKKPAGTSR